MIRCFFVHTTNIIKDLMTNASKFKLKEDDSSEITIQQNDIHEIVPDADFRFSLIILKNGDKHFVCGTDQDIKDSFEKS